MLIYFPILVNIHIQLFFVCVIRLFASPFSQFVAKLCIAFFASAFYMHFYLALVLLLVIYYRFE